MTGLLPITATDYYKGHDVDYAGDLTSIIEANARTLLARVNELLALAEEETKWTFRGINSGWRPIGYNEALRAQGYAAAINSKHICGQAIDVDDDDGILDDWLLTFPTYLVDTKLWMEHPAATKGWCHLQSVPPRSGNRVFYP